MNHRVGAWGQKVANFTWVALLAVALPATAPASTATWAAVSGMSVLNTAAKNRLENMWHKSLTDFLRYPLVDLLVYAATIHVVKKLLALGLQYTCWDTFRSLEHFDIRTSLIWGGDVFEMFRAFGGCVSGLCLSISPWAGLLKSIMSSPTEQYCQNREPASSNMPCCRKWSRYLCWISSCKN